jgi:hypothetical protein
VCMIPNPSTLVQTSPVERPSVPPWFAEVAIMAQHLASKGLLEAFARAGCVWCGDASATMKSSIFSPC